MIPKYIISGQSAFVYVTPILRPESHHTGQCTTPHITINITKPNTIKISTKTHTHTNPILIQTILTFKSSSSNTTNYIFPILTTQTTSYQQQNSLLTYSYTHHSLLTKLSSRAPTFIYFYSPQNHLHPTKSPTKLTTLHQHTTQLTHTCPQHQNSPLTPNNKIQQTSKHAFLLYSLNNTTTIDKKQQRLKLWKLLKLQCE